MELPPQVKRQILEAFRPVVGTATLDDDPMDFNRVPKVETGKVDERKR